MHYPLHLEKCTNALQLALLFSITALPEKEKKSYFLLKLSEKQFEMNGLYAEFLKQFVKKVFP